MTEVRSRWGMFNQFIDEIAGTLSPIARDVWMVIFRHANGDGKAFLTRKRIADSLNVSTVHVSHGIKILKEAGLIDNNSGGYGYTLLSQTVNDSLHMEDDVETQDSKQEFTPQLTTVNTPVNNSLLDSKQEFTHYRTSLQNIFTEHITEPPIVPQAKEPKKDSDAFLAFWEAYPSKTGKGAARISWKKKRCDKRIDEILNAVEAQKHSARWKAGYIPNPATWINQERWDDTPIQERDRFGQPVEDINIEQEINF